MDAVGADQDVAARGMGVRAAAVEEIGGDAAFVLGERAEPAAGADGIGTQPLDHGLMDDALQAAAVDRELRHVVAGIQAALLVPDLLAVAGQIEQLMGADRDLVEPVQQADGGKLADRMRQRIDADAEFADRVRLFVKLAVDAAGPQHERGGEAADTTADDDRLHGSKLHSTPDATRGPSVARSLIRPQAALSPRP